MDTINLAGARARLSNLVGWVEAGDTVCIAQRGRPVRLTAGATQRKRIDRATLERRWRPFRAHLGTIRRLLAGRSQCHLKRAQIERGS